MQPQKKETIEHHRKDARRRKLKKNVHFFLRRQTLSIQNGHWPLIKYANNGFVFIYRLPFFFLSLWPDTHRREAKKNENRSKKKMYLDERERNLRFQRDASSCCVPKSRRGNKRGEKKAKKKTNKTKQNKNATLAPALRGRYPSVTSSIGSAQRQPQRHVGGWSPGRRGGATREPKKKEKKGKKKEKKVADQLVVVHRGLSAALDGHLNRCVRVRVSPLGSSSAATTTSSSSSSSSSSSFSSGRPPPAAPCAAAAPPVPPALAALVAAAP